jgi:hypothetical protein
MINRSELVVIMILWGILGAYIYYFFNKLIKMKKRRNEYIKSLKGKARENYINFLREQGLKVE